MKMIRMMYLQ